MKLSHIAVYLVLATVGAKRFDHWSLNDIEFFLSDRGIDYKGLESERGALVTLAEEEFSKLKREHASNSGSTGAVQHILNYVIGGEKEPTKWDFFSFDSDEESVSDLSVKDWIFDSWSKSNLQAFLKLNKISFGKKTQKSDLVSLAKQHYDDIAKSLNLSGFYPGAWIYSAWSVDDLKKWLANNDITVDAAAESKDQLVSKVQEYNYLASLELQDSKKALFDSLLLGDQDIFDKAGKVKQEFIDSWSYSQLREWLYYQGLIDTKPGIHLDSLDKEKLQKLVSSNSNYLITDIKTWADEAGKLASPILEKGSEVAQLAGEVINDTFLVGVEKWDKERLQQFLSSRNIKIPHFATHKSLVNLVQKNANTPLSKLTGGFLDNLSTDTIRNWLQQNGQEIEGSRQELVSRLEAYISSGQQLSEEIKLQIAEQISSYKPDFEEYKVYAAKAIEDANNLASSAADDVQEHKSIAEDTIVDAYKVGTEYYESAAKLIGAKFARNSKKLNEALIDAKKASYEYSSSFASGIKETKPKLDEALKSAQVEGASYANYINEIVSSKLDDLQSSGEAASNVVSDLWEQANAYVNKFLKPKVEAEVSSAAEAATGVGASALLIYAKATGLANDYASDAHDAVQYAYGEAKSTSGEYVGLATDSIASAYTDASSSWSSFWDSLLEADVKAYLRSFGYSKKFLNNISHDQLYRLVQQQTDVYFGSTSWDKSISEIISGIFETEKTPLEKIKDAVNGI